MISDGLGGLVFIAVGSVLLLSADLQDDWRKLDTLETKLDRLKATADLDARIAALEAQLHEGDLPAGPVPVPEPAPRPRSRRAPALPPGPQPVGSNAARRRSNAS